MALEPCPYCFTAMRVTWWDHAVGLAAQCPKCRAYSGPPWTLRRLVVLALGSLFINALVLFAVARPLKALALITFYVAVVGALFFAASGTGNDVVFTTAIIAMVFGPACIAAIEYVWHAVDLERGPLLPAPTAVAPSVEPATNEEDTHEIAPRGAPRFVGTTEMQAIRNALEISIFHHEEQLKVLAYAAYFIPAIGAVLGALQKQWLAVAFMIILVGVAYTAAVHESRAFAVAYALAGVTLVGRFFSLGVGGRDVPGGLTLSVAAFAIGVGLSRLLFIIAALRRVRKQIPLGPAEHLQ